MPTSWHSEMMPSRKTLISFVEYSLVPLIARYKNLKGLKKENLRDNMTTLELVLNMLAEATTTQFSKDRKPTTFQENLAVAKAGGQVAGRTRKDIESQSNMPVISPKNAVQLNQVITDLLEDATSDMPKKMDDK